MSTDSEKQDARENIWSLLEREQAATKSIRDRIPAFHGADLAADRLSTLEAWRSTRAIKSVPDTAQLPVRIQALNDGKLLYMAAPRLAAAKPFYLLDPGALDIPAAQAATKAVAAEIARNVDVDEMTPVDMVVLGSVAVDRRGARLGKGAGYSDIELALLQEDGLIGDQTVIATTVHQLQVVDDPLPEAVHDFRVDVIVTPDEVVWCQERRRPAGLNWESLPPEKISAIPALAGRRNAL